jgi:hypothetical protein
MPFYHIRGANLIGIILNDDRGSILFYDLQREEFHIERAMSEMGMDSTEWCLEGYGMSWVVTPS